ncbi:hypothetical protein Patl1_23313 [Pistacia atlantica]|uniref:Uncharacterized protein n=1 Tax=Pistacia atlantica TaxID=434234 RepID=A0ACC0ZV04_9ROSI|nr:hypothetical protein Patl1_23313 [Pistacia atlantica]
MGFEIGQLPVSYLGVPLITSRLYHNDCIPLIEKVEKRVSSWKKKALSYASRLQLVISVLSSKQVYWASIFILPSSVSKAIKKILRSFLWVGNDMGKGKAKVAWKDIFLPKSEGGLGIRSLSMWNLSLMTYHAWNVVSQKDSLWVKWIHSYRLCRHSFWSVNIPWDASWCWRKILLMRDLLRAHVGLYLANGHNTSLWYDSWHPLGPFDRIVP